jgi:2-(3-amino-3-carboxypropyl)histidine synthase
MSSHHPILKLIEKVIQQRETYQQQLQQEIQHKKTFIENFKNKNIIITKTNNNNNIIKRATLDIPPDIADNPQLDEAISTSLPSNYNFEIKKTLWRIRKSGAKRVALQMPEGLLIFACPIADIITSFAPGNKNNNKIEVVIMGDVTYGACCIDDFSAKALGVTLLIHYGHSCLIPVDITKSDTGVEIMYVFVDVSFDASHAVECIKLEFNNSNNKTTPQRLALMGTIQFSGGALHQAKKLLLDAGFDVVVPQEKPLSGGEVLGCTAPRLLTATTMMIDAIIFISDGRFHLESAMIANPNIPAYRYDPYGKTLTRESYDHDKMMKDRLDTISRAKLAKKWGVILGTLGRQGNVRVLERVVKWLQQREKEYFIVLLSELSPSKLDVLQKDAGIESWIQIACPRLSVDWSRAFSVPLLTTYEACVALGYQEWKSVYPQDYYSKNGGQWSNYFVGGS